MKTEQRNAAGFKDYCDMYRTFNGEHYTAFDDEPTDGILRTLRERGVKCRRSAGVLFIRETDCHLTHGITMA